MKSPAYYDTYDYPSYWKERDYEHDSEVMAINSLVKNLPQRGIAADVGGGFGRLIPCYISCCSKLILVEPSENLLSLARSRFGNNSNVSFVAGAVDNLRSEFKPGSLDTIFMVRVMHHLADPRKTIKILSSLLKKDGILVLEFANKIHGKALFQNICKGDFTFPLDLAPSDRRCLKNQKKETISFYNYHPDTILEALKEENMAVKKIRSVSNVRSSSLKKYLPFKILMAMEKILQEPLAKIYFGPSIFVLAQKRG